MTLDFKIAIITGASRGIGRAIALELAADGIGVVLTARDQQALDNVAGEAKKAGAPATLVIATDLSEASAPDRVVAQSIEEFGRLDILVNNAGDTKRGDFLELTDEDHLSGFALKYHAMVRFCRAGWPHLAKTSGSIINISGIGAHTPESVFTIGGPVNSAIINFTKALSCRAPQDGLRVNTVSPGHIVTERLNSRIEAYAGKEDIPYQEAKERIRVEREIRRFGEPEEIAAMVAFLCSDRGAYVHGATIIVDGGATPGI
ncbi:MAG: SDR family oxidoreductase [Rhodospirillaceae bacterium]|nr:SDR family oxidoreductase [Rhodospirillaceae bacterium]